MGEVASVQTVVLHDEEYVEEDGEGTEPELGGVAEDGSPVVVVKADDEHLQDGEGAPGGVQQDVANAPACRALPSTNILTHFLFLHHF